MRKPCGRNGEKYSVTTNVDGENREQTCDQIYIKNIYIGLTWVNLCEGSFTISKGVDTNTELHADCAATWRISLVALSLSPVSLTNSNFE